MASSNVQRKLTAILCADVVGYSRLMGENEKATLRILTDYRQVFADYIEKFRGRIVNAPGDSILAEFGSVVDGAAARTSDRATCVPIPATFPHPSGTTACVSVLFGFSN